MHGRWQAVASGDRHEERKVGIGIAGAVLCMMWTCELWEQVSVVGGWWVCGGWLVQVIGELVCARTRGLYM